MTEATHDVISISSSDDDSDCQIVKVIPSPRGQRKSKMRWQYHARSLRRANKGRKRMARQRNEDAYDDHQDKEPTSKGYTPHSEADLIAVSGDAARNDCSQSVDQSIDPLRFGSMANHSSSHETSDAKAERPEMMRVDPIDPLANRHHTADLGHASMLPPPFPSQRPDPSEQIPQDSEDKQRDIRSRSCSAATLDFERADAQRGDYQGSERDVQGVNTDVLDGQPELLLGGTTNSADCANHPQPFANLANEDGSILPLESLLEESNRDAIKLKEPQDGETGSLRPYKRAPTASRRRLPQVGKRRAWSSIINFAAYEAMPTPLFTQQKETIRSVTYDDMIEERAERKANKE
ncbi:hypothetical protein M441DRAFT_144534 [Trichoderma asperellum CBS 433.97]|uniref:Uncharacterized protein n=2 Tax=Trichoderma asperellum TaxID=101201 RepID=A0A2T3Z2U1_TRIA4|nr:hypothetical protein M441DRAFT_144534 [Trichoderma asperellum CBS 433.97]PTB39113.1 hypothetical protein M441DRAFT_144534 [Trichoderma asperellum CBS 433.97]